LGSTVHAVLDGIVRDALGDAGDRDEGTWPEAVDVAWPGAEELERRIAEAARAVLRDEGVGLPGLEHVLAIQARPYLERARELEWGEGGTLASVVGAEVDEVVDVVGADGRPRSVRFRADRADLVDGKHPRLTDYKTGKPFSNAKGESKRREHLLKEVMAGRSLQAVAYRNAGGAGGEGRFLFLREDLEPGLAEFKATADDAALGAAFDRCTRAVFDAWEAGLFLPRLVEHDRQKDYGRCDGCEVSQACLHRDSGARARLVRWLEDRDGRRDLPPVEAAIRAWWDLHQKPDPATLASGGEGA
jgi:RecB family exonuclease